MRTPPFCIHTCERARQKKKKEKQTNNRITQVVSFLPFLYFFWKARPSIHPSIQSSMAFLCQRIISFPSLHNSTYLHISRRDIMPLLHTPMLLPIPMPRPLPMRSQQQRRGAATAVRPPPALLTAAEAEADEQAEGEPQERDEGGGALWWWGLVCVDLINGLSVQ